MRCRFKSVAGLMVAAAMLIACDSDQSATQGSITDSDLTLPIPARIRDVRAIDPANVIATAIVNGVPVTLQRNNSGGYSGAIQVPSQSTFAVEIEFSEQFAGQNLLLATRSEQVSTGTTDQQLNLRRAGYNFALHDADGDSVSNIVEREENTDPLDGSDSPSMINVTVVAERPAVLNASSFNQFLFEGSVGADAKALTPSGSNFTGNFFVVDRTPLNASVQMIETVTGDQLAVATQTRQLNTVVDQQSIIFESGVYSTTDIDRDGRSDLAELIAGTDINGPDDPPPVTTVALTTQFNSPSFIQNAQSIYAEYRLNDQLITLSRSLNNFAATSNVAPGATVNLEVTLLDNFNNLSYVLARAQKSVSIGNTAQTASFIESDFVFNLDNDNDGSFNYQEREQGTDPFNPPVVIPPMPVSCNVSPLPITIDSPGKWVTISNISSYIDCGGESYALNGSLFNFTWSSDADTIGWLIPEDSEDGDSFSYQIEVTNPEVVTDVYTSLIVNTRVEGLSCAVGTRMVQLEAAEDIFFQNNRIFNNNELRVNAANRRALIGFDVPAQEGELTAAELVVTVGDDGGSGTVGVYQNDAYQWSETDSGLVSPPLTNLVGSRDGPWLIDGSYRIGLDALFVSGPRVNLFLQQEAGGNDVAFTSRETGSPAILVLEYTGCF